MNKGVCEIVNNDEYIIVNGNLYHYGIPGMKWGVRRFQKKDGALTSAGKKRYDDDHSKGNKSSPVKKKSKHRVRLEEAYKAKGFSREEAEAKASKRIKIEKVLAVTAGVTVAAASAYVIHNNIKARTDQLIKAGDTMQRIEGQQLKSDKNIFGFKKKNVDLNKNLHDSFYVTNNAYDNKNYADAFGYQKVINDRYNKAFRMDIKATKDIKIASQEKAKNTLRDLMKNDEEFKKNIYKRDLQIDLRGRHYISNDHIKKFMNGEKVPNSVAKKIYDNFNSNLVGAPRDKAESISRNLYYEALKKQGYGGIQDINDLKWSNLRGKNPLIVFDKSKVNVESITDITENMSRRKHDNAYRRMDVLVNKQRLLSLLPGTAVVSSLVPAKMVSNDVKDYIGRNSKKTFIEAYRYQHPNTNLSNREIAAMYKNK